MQSETSTIHSQCSTPDHVETHMSPSPGQNVPYRRRSKRPRSPYLYIGTHDELQLLRKTSSAAQVLLNNTQAGRKTPRNIVDQVRAELKLQRKRTPL